MNIQEVTPHTDRQEPTHGTAAKATSTEERLLIAQAKSGRSSAFGELYERHRLRIYCIALRILRNQEDAEDATQRSFQRAFVSLGRFREDSTFSTWVTRIAINEALMLLRHRRASIPLLEGNSDGNDASSMVDRTRKVPTPEEILAENELRATVTQGISYLRESLRTVALLRELQGLTSAETARRLGLTVSAVKARTFHARRHLRQHLERKCKGALHGFLAGARN
jgi:RNA polymerase sigma-70 factor (ECF subfamily)